jgi:hypothetical protein
MWDGVENSPPVEWLLTRSSQDLLEHETSKVGLDNEKVITTFCSTALDWHFENCVYNYLEYQAGVKPDDVDLQKDYFDPYWQNYRFDIDSDYLSGRGSLPDEIPTAYTRSSPLHTSPFVQD